MRQAEQVTRTPSVVELFYERSPRSRRLYERALRVIPSGNTRTVIFYRPYPVYAAKGKGSHIWDVDGNERIDYCLNYSTLILGHAHPRVIKAIREQLEYGTALGQPTELEIQLAEKIAEMVPCAERVKFTVTGTEAAMNAVRAARAFTKRKKIIMFEGAYHGSSDSVVGHGTSYVSEGVPQEFSQNSVVLPFDDQKSVEKAFSDYREQVAAVLMEPVLGAGGAIAPHPEFPKIVRELTQKNDALLIFDEIITGFRLAPGGAQELFKVKPDLATYAKKIAGGLPGAALVGLKNIMDDVFGYPDSSSPEVLKPKIPLSGTYNAHPLTMAAGLATLHELNSAAYETLNGKGNSIRSGITKIANDLGVNVQVTGIGSLFNIYFHHRPVSSYAESKLADGRARWYFDLEMMNRGVYFSPGHFCCTSTATNETDIMETLRAYENALDNLKPVLRETSQKLIQKD